MISVITSRKELIIITLLITLLLITRINPPVKKISNLRINDYATINVTINNQKQYNHLTIINASDETGSIKCVFFKKVKLRKNELIIGRLTEYNNEKEFIGTRVI